MFLTCDFRYLDDVSLHHLINALCSLSLEAMEMAYGNNKVKKNILFFTTCSCFAFMLLK